MIYLGSPYSSSNLTEREDRYRTVRNLVMDMAFKRNIYLFSPILYCHRASEELTLPTDALSWENMNTAFQRSCSAIWVLVMEGSHESIGLNAEIKLAETIGQPITYVDYEGKFLYSGIYKWPE